ncbi:MAG: HAD-IA family hydrolase, partial [Roseiarcus sp.]
SGAMDAEGYLGGFAERLGGGLTLDAWTGALRAALTPLPEALALAATLGRRALVAVLTNNNLLVAREIDAIFPELRPIFGRNIFVSAEFRARKPAPEVYRRCLARLGATPEAALFVDDSSRNVAGAEAAGLSGCLYVGADALAERLRGERLLPHTG